MKSAVHIHINTFIYVNKVTKEFGIKFNIKKTKLEFYGISYVDSLTGHIFSPENIRPGSFPFPPTVLVSNLKIHFQLSVDKGTYECNL